MNEFLARARTIRERMEQQRAELAERERVAQQQRAELAERITPPTVWDPVEPAPPIETRRATVGLTTQKLIALRVRKQSEAGGETMSSDNILERPLYELIISARPYNALMHPGYNGQPSEPYAKTIGDLAAMSANELLRVPNIGKVSVQEIREALAAHGLRLRGEEPVSPPVIPRRVVQIALMQRDHLTTIYALADDGTVWRQTPDSYPKDWQMLTRLPPL